MPSFLSQALDSASPLLVLAVVIGVGIGFGTLSRRVGLPSITGQILGGILLGSAGLGLFDEDSLRGLQPITHLALGLIAVTVGAHLNVRRLRNAGRRLSVLLISEATITPLIVYVALRYVGGTTFEVALLLATVSIATAPATIVTLVRETRSKGVFVKTLLAAVALNNVACIVLFEFARSLVSEVGPQGFQLEALLDPLGQVALAVVVGFAIALVMEAIARASVRPDHLATAAVLALMLACGLADAIGVSPLLTCLVLGFVQTNIARERSHLAESVFADFEPAILAVFFTLGGMHMSLEHALLASLAAALLFTARLAGKLVAAQVAMRLAGATDRVRRNLGLALTPQAGVAVGLVLLIQEDPGFADIAGLFSAVVLTVVTLNEIVGPILTRRALVNAGEAGKDRTRLIDFLQEEHIATRFAAEHKEEAIEKLVDLLLRTHTLPGVSRDDLLNSVLERESQGSTCFGGGLAVPHGILPDGTPMVGVMALSQDGLDFETPDGRPVHCMVLLGTSMDERERHLQVLASLARTVGSDVAFQDQLFNADTPAHACEVLHGEESEDFNYFLDDER
jgi:Kef-type K+ transport system membrane component KefB/mannitol/fructose-specific phosphotransferase system IIA component (Ntr-type)